MSAGDSGSASAPSAWPVDDRFDDATDDLRLVFLVEEASRLASRDRLFFDPIVMSTPSMPGPSMAVDVAVL